MTIDKPNKRVRPVGGKENEDADVNDSDQEDQLLSNQVIVVDMLQNVMLSSSSIIHLLYISASVMWTNVTFIPSGAIWL